MLDRIQGFPESLLDELQSSQKYDRADRWNSNASDLLLLCVLDALCVSRKDSVLIMKRIGVTAVLFSSS